MLDLFTGTGAGVAATCEVLDDLGKKPQEIVAVDNFHYQPGLKEVMERSKYATGRDEVIRNLADVQANAIVVAEDVLPYVRNLASGQTLPFELVTAFSVPINFGRPSDLLEVLQLIDPKTLSFFTFGARSFGYTRNLQGQIKQKGLDNQWKFYLKPEGIHPRDWDLVILANRELALLKLA